MYLYFLLSDLSSFHFWRTYVIFFKLIVGSFPLCQSQLLAAVQEGAHVWLEDSHVQQGCTHEGTPPPMQVLNKEGRSWLWENLKSTGNLGPLGINCAACLCCIVKALVWRFPVLPFTTVGWCFLLGSLLWDAEWPCLSWVPREMGKQFRCVTHPVRQSAKPQLQLEMWQWGLGRILNLRLQALSQCLADWDQDGVTNYFLGILPPGPGLAVLRWRGGLCVSEQHRAISVAELDQLVF